VRDRNQIHWLILFYEYTICKINLPGYIFFAVSAPSLRPLREAFLKDVSRKGILLKF
jgi:hypothetical protein